MISERDCINRILHYVQGLDRQDLVKGIGDDCAVIRKDGGEVLLLTTDTLVEGVHFDLSWHPPYLLGRKCAAVNLSDIAAMGGKPCFCLLSVGFPGTVPSWFDDFMEGFTTLLREHDVLLVGGDTVKSRSDLVISVMVMGEGNRRQICYRSGAQPGDLVWVSGFLGNAAAGLDLCRAGIFRPGQGAGKWQQLVMAHLDPAPQVGLGRLLAESGCVHAMMDISDGLATDLAHLCRESGVGAEIDQPRIPLAESLLAAASEHGGNALEWALKGGEDYQLLFTTGSEDAQKITKIFSENAGMESYCIGRVTEKQGVFLCGSGTEPREISFQGFDHFVIK